MKTFLLTTGLVLSLVFAVSAAPEAPTPAILQMLNEGRPEEQMLKPEDVRISHPADFPEATLVGFLSGPNACLLGRVIVENKALSPGEATGVLLRQRGWETADGPEKSRLAMLWLRQGLLGFGDEVLEKKPAGFGDAETRFQPPDVLCTLSGAVRITTWIEEPPGPSSQRYFRHSLYWFARNGDLVRSKIMERFEMPGN